MLPNVLRLVEDSGSKSAVPLTHLSRYLKRTGAAMNDNGAVVVPCCSPDFLSAARVVSMVMVVCAVSRRPPLASAGDHLA